MAFEHDSAIGRVLTLDCALSVLENRRENTRMDHSRLGDDMADLFSHH